MIPPPQTDAESLLFKEWGLLEQEVSALREYYKKTLMQTSKKRVRAFAIGSPRNFTLILLVRFQGTTFRKTLRGDIRDGSHHFWIPQLDEKDWEMC